MCSWFMVYLSTSWHSPVNYSILLLTGRLLDVVDEQVRFILGTERAQNEGVACSKGQRSRVKFRVINLQLGENTCWSLWFAFSWARFQWGVFEISWIWLLEFHKEYWDCKALDLWSYMHCNSTRTMDVQCSTETRKKGGCGHVMKGL